MAVRTDVTIDFESSPRIITVAAPSVEITMQDLVDTVRTIEARADAIDNDHVLDAAGKQSLGGGVLVGITVTLRNAKLAFEARGGPTYEQCNISGGNLVAVDDVGSPMSPIEPTAFTQIVLANSSSATLSELEAIQYSSYQNAVWVDVIDGMSGTDYPSGTREFPVNNIPDAVSIANTKGFDTLQILGNITLTTGDDLPSFRVVGRSPNLTVIVIEAGANVINCEFSSAYITGVLDGNSIINQCVVGDLYYVEGAIRESMVNGTIQLGGTAPAFLFSIVGGIPAGNPTVDYNGSSQGLVVRGYHGQLTLINKTNAGSDSLEWDSGELFIDSSCTNGSVHVHGVCEVFDNSGPGCSVTAEDVVSPVSIANAVWDESLTASSHNIATSAGRRLRQLASAVVHEGTAQGAGTNNNQIQLDLAASSVDGAYDPSLLCITDGTGAGQTRLILEYDGATRTATVDRSWKVAPDATSTFVISGHPGREHTNEGLAQGGSANTITLNSLASANDDEYVGMVVSIRSGTGEDQACRIVGYDGTTKVATIARDWNVVPDTTSAYVILATSVLDLARYAGIIASSVWGAVSEGSYTYADLLKIISAALAGKLSGAPSGPIVIRDVNDGKNRITATVDANGNRTGVTLDVSS